MKEQRRKSFQGQRRDLDLFDHNTGMSHSGDINRFPANMIVRTANGVHEGCTDLSLEAFSFVY